MRIEWGMRKLWTRNKEGLSTSWGCRMKIINTERMMATWNFRIRIQSGMEIWWGSRIKKSNCVGASKIQEWGLPEEWEFDEVHEVPEKKNYPRTEDLVRFLKGDWLNLVRFQNEYEMRNEDFGQIPEWRDEEWGFFEAPEWVQSEIKKKRDDFFGSRMGIKWGMMIFRGSRMRTMWGLKKGMKILWFQDEA